MLFAHLKRIPRLDRSQNAWLDRAVKKRREDAAGIVFAGARASKSVWLHMVASICVADR
jgi:hypothetical protein